MDLQRMGPLAFFSWFSDDWIVSVIAQRLFLVSTLLVFALTPLFLGQIDVSHMSFSGRLPWGILAIIGPVGMFFLWLGMWRYWARIDDSRQGSKRLWFLVLLIGFWYGSCLYFYFVYCRQVTRRQRPLA